VTTTAAKKRVVRISKDIFDRFFDFEEVEFASVGSGTDVEMSPCVVCLTPRIKGEPCKVCAARPYRCLWCCSVREETRGPCPSCGKYGITKFEEREKSCVYVEEI
jgi:hypothetical protein